MDVKGAILTLVLCMSFEECMQDGRIASTERAKAYAIKELAEAQAIKECKEGGGA